ncbi:MULTISPECIES: NIF family HAD-type phosphatase [unclassified Stenotrophomonas]|uniref:NIF family HAD-type phosphatase n=1 Tax=unclassified Stenotrophomonas TaxID=196198 RepID=UPI001E557A26|nr:MULTISPECIES: NIF family HAD-type phosphatase [unclassified Stenotrophomonas]
MRKHLSQRQGMKPTILALDLEGTLISNAISQIPRPGLCRFLEDVRTRFDRLMIFTTVPEERFRTIATLLARDGSAPDWFASLQYINWSGKTKDLRLISPHLGQALLLDDYGPYVHPGQEHLWVKIPLFGSPYPAEDDGLSLAMERLLGCLNDGDELSIT